MEKLVKSIIPIKMTIITVEIIILRPSKNAKSLALIIACWNDNLFHGWIKDLGHTIFTLSEYDDAKIKIIQVKKYAFQA